MSCVWNIQSFKMEKGNDIGPDQIWTKQPEQFAQYRIVQMAAGKPGEKYYTKPVYVQNWKFTDLSPKRPWTAGCENEKMYSEENRLKTFENLWLSSFHVTKEDCAKNGLYYWGPYDTVRCAFCLGKLYNFEEGDTVEEEHKRIHENCPFVTGECLSSNIEIKKKKKKTFCVIL